MRPESEIVGGNVLRIPGIQSPNFSQVNQTGWGIFQDGTAFFFAVQVIATIIASQFQGTNFVIDQLGARFYSGTPAAGNLIASVAPSAGADSFGNTFNAGFFIGGSGELIAGNVVVNNQGIFEYGSAAQVTVLKITGSGNIAIPAGGVLNNTVKAESWAGGGGGGVLASFGGGAGGGGEYAMEPALTAAAGGNIAYVVGAAGTGGIVGGAASTSGGNSTLTSTDGLTTVTAHGGTKGTTANGGAGGHGSTNNTHHNGGSGGSVPAGDISGGGGGSSAGPSNVGNNGQSGGSNAGGLGGSSVPGGGAGGQGGGTQIPNGGDAVAGGSPGGGGGGGSPAGTTGNGAAGAHGQVQITYKPASNTLVASLAPAAGTDQFGNAFPQGIFLAAQTAPATPTGGASFYVDTSNRPSFKGPSGQAQTQMASNSVSVGSTTVTGTTGAIATATIPANDAVAGSVYELIAFGNGTSANPAVLMVFQAAIAGTGQGVSQGPAAAALPAAAAAFRWTMTVRLVIRTAGAAGTAVVGIDGVLALSGGNEIPGTAANNCFPISGGVSTTFTFNTTIANTIALNFSTSSTATATAIGAYLKKVA